MKRKAVPQSAAARLENAFSLKTPDKDNSNGNDQTAGARRTPNHTPSPDPAKPARHKP